MSQQLAAQNDSDLAAILLQFALVILFPTSRGAGFSAALQAAKGASAFQQLQIGNQVYFASAYGPGRADMVRASMVLSLMAGCKGLQVYVQGRLSRQPLRIAEVVECYLHSLSCHDSRAHCHVQRNDAWLRRDEVMGNWERPAAKQHALIPCRQIVRYGAGYLSSNHPATAEDQLQARAVERGCDWCPNFRPQDFKQL